MSLLNDLKGLKSKLGNFEEEFESTLKELEVKKNEETKRQVKEESIQNILNKKDPVVTMNIGGQLFKCSHSVLTSVKDSLFEKLYENGTRVNEVIFYDRSFSCFPAILNYLRTKTFNPKQYVKLELEEIKFESEYYGLTDMTKICDDVLSQVEFVSFESSGKYSNCGTHKVKIFI